MKILQISCSYFPDKFGGTEFYVRNLSKELLLRGHKVFISYVNGFNQIDGARVRMREYVLDGIPVFVIEKNTFSSKTCHLYFDSEDQIYPLFKEYLKRIQPDIVHFHHFSPIGVLSQMKAAKEMKLPIILTYHTPMMTCGHSDMLYLGRRQCEGRIEYKRCLICTQTKYKIPFCLAWIWASLPKGIAYTLGKFISAAGVKLRFATWLQLPWLIRERIERWQSGFKMIDHFVTVCSWVYGLLLRNDILPKKISLCPQGINSMPKIIKKPNNGILHLGYVGRIHPMKGIDILLRALRLLPHNYQIELSIYGSYQDGEDKKNYHKLYQQSYKDKRIKWRGILTEEKKAQALSELDALVIPSRWLETGPLVLLESWAVATPVIGSRLGGIAELITDGMGGLLFNPEDPLDLSQKIMRIYKEPDLLNGIRANIPKIPTMEEVARDMENLYQRFMR